MDETDLRAELDDAQADVAVLTAILAATARMTAETLAPEAREKLFALIEIAATGWLLRPAEPLPPQLDQDRAEAARRVRAWLQTFRRCAPGAPAAASGGGPAPH